MHHGSSIPSLYHKRDGSSFACEQVCKKSSSKGKKRSALAILLCPRYSCQADCGVRALRVAAPCSPREAPFLAGLSEEDGGQAAKKKPEKQG